MKYKLLLIGNNKELISDFFTQMNDTFECISSSGNYEDLTIAREMKGATM